MVVREMNFMRRTVGQVIVAAAIIDDTIGWTIMAVTFGLATHGGLDVASVAQSVLGTALFLLASFTIGRRAVSLLIRWANDTLVSDVPVITTILVVTVAMALITHAIGVHTVLGAFVAGILIGQSPILTRHIDEQLRGLIIALFMPLFFGLAGLNANLAIVKNPSLLLLSLGFIVIASLGKFSGAFLGGAVGGPDMARVAGDRVRHERPRFDRSDRRLHRAVDGSAQPRSLHDDRGDGGGDDNGDATDAALGSRSFAVRPGGGGAARARGH
jgi:Kef-type K+ transport system membrane component KefB